MYRHTYIYIYIYTHVHMDSVTLPEVVRAQLALEAEGHEEPEASSLGVRGRLLACQQGFLDLQSTQNDRPYTLNFRYTGYCFGYFGGPGMPPLPLTTVTIFFVGYYSKALYGIYR